MGDPTLDAIEQLRSLPRGWDSYNADPVHPSAQREAMDYALAASRWISQHPTVGATADGGVTLTWRMPDGGAILALFSPAPKKQYLKLDAQRKPVEKGDLHDPVTFARDILKRDLPF